MTGPSSVHLDPEPEDAARRRDLVRFWKAVLDIRINAPGVDRQLLAVGTDLKDDIIERVRRKEVHGLARCIGFRIAFAKNLFEAGEARPQPDRLDIRRALVGCQLIGHRLHCGVIMSRKSIGCYRADGPGNDRECSGDRRARLLIARLGEVT